MLSTDISIHKNYALRLFSHVLNVMDNGWRIICTIPEPTFLESVHNSTFYMSIISGIITYIVIVASFMIGRFGTRRINALTSVSKKIADGDFTKEVSFMNGDEIGHLGKTFNIMIAAIKNRIEQLKYLNDVALEMHSHIDLEVLLQDVINISRKLINAGVGALILLDEQKKKIKYFKVSSLHPQESYRITEEIQGKEFLKMIMKRNTSIRLEDAENDPRFTDLPIAYRQVRTLFGVPIKIDSTTVGGLFLANKFTNGKFTLKDKELILIISYQATVAIENAKLYGEVQQLAITDGLTGLLNHKEFHRRLDENIEGSKRYKYEVALLMIDIDHFKYFNDTYGHQTGDFVLKTVGHLIKSQTRAADTCARYGGEEFAMILRETDMHQTAILAERIRSTVYTYPFKYGTVRSQLSVSIGIAAFPKDADNAEHLIKKADEALYKAKESGRNMVFRYTRDL